MTDVVVATKTCTACGEEKPASDFYRHRGARDGLYPQCKACKRARQAEVEARRREEMGEEAYLAHKARIVRDYRRKPEGRSRTRLANSVRNEAVRRLVELRRTDYEHLLSVVWSEVEHGEIEL